MSQVRTHTRVASPLGWLTLVATDGVLSGLFMDRDERGLWGPRELGDADVDGFDVVAGQLEEFFARRRTGFDVPLALAGTEFQRAVWRELSSVPFGATVTYAQIAARLGRSVSVARAVGAANGANPVAIIVPCHRVVGSTGLLTGYAGGVARKRWLLDFELGAGLF